MRRRTILWKFTKYLAGALMCSTTVLASGQETNSIPGLASALSWQNSPQSWSLSDRTVLTISSKAKADWFVDPFDGTVANSAPIFSFMPNSDFVLSARVSVTFKTKWDAGALMLMGDDRHWAKLSYELSPDGKPTLVTVVTRGLSDDCNSVSLSDDSVYLRIARSSKTYIFYFATDATRWNILRTFSLDYELPIRVGFESQSPAGDGATARFSSITYDTHTTRNIYK
jgi:uncharacterized protein